MATFTENHLNAHNAYRAKHGCAPLVLDENCTRVAKEWANHLASRRVMYHRPNNRYGENIYMMAGNPPPTVNGKMPVKAWYDEIRHFRFGSGGFSMQTGHFTQVVWKSTTKMGVGKATNSSGQTFVVTNYFPPGNMQGKFNSNVPRRIK